MRQILIVILAALILAAPARAATLQDDHLFICDKTADISPALQPSALMDSAGAELEAKQFGLIYERFAQRYEATLSPAERAARPTTKYISNIRGAGALTSNLFDVSRALDGTSEKLFESSDDEISFNCAGLTPHDVDMAAVALMTRWVRSQESLHELEGRALFVAKQSRAHEALLYNGLPMWPWELWLNGKRLGESDWDPLFKTQWVLMRPTAGIEINTRNRASGNLDASVGIEPLGFARYQDDGYKSWWGASLLVTSSTNAGIGLGGLLRWNNFVLGVTRHESNSADMPASNFIFIGIELYDYANKQRGDFAEWKRLQKKSGIKGA